jgi:hypothetical protein
MLPVAPYAAKLLHMDAADESMALQVVGWIVSDQRRAERMLAVSGLSADGLRTAIRDPRQLGAILDFVLDHEPDLLSCADALGVQPQKIAAVRERLGE